MADDQTPGSENKPTADDISEAVEAAVEIVEAANDVVEVESGSDYDDDDYDDGGFF